MFEVGKKVGPFVIERELGSGAMGTVYRARYDKDGQIYALKVMSFGVASNETARARFEREANILKQLKHPNIVRLFGSGHAQKHAVFRDGIRRWRIARPHHGPPRAFFLGRSRSDG